ncbi:hypothetical protein NKH18_45170 [Streptomyces sp. M10(2022)]
MAATTDGKGVLGLTLTAHALVKVSGPLGTRWVTGNLVLRARVEDVLGLGIITSRPSPASTTSRPSSRSRAPPTGVHCRHRSCAGGSWTGWTPRTPTRRSGWTSANFPRSTGGRWRRPPNG